MKIDRDKLFEDYIVMVNDICDECDWVTSFGPKEIVNMIVDLLEGGNYDN